MVSPGFQNKFQSVLNNILSYDAITANMERQMKLSDKKNGRDKPLHMASLRERESIYKFKRTFNGDY